MAEILDGGNASSTYDENPEVGGFSPSSRTLSEIMVSVKRTFGDESGVQLEDADIIRWTNDAQDTIVNRNKVLKAKASTTSVAGEDSYSFPTENIHQVDSIHYDGVRLENIPFAEAERTLFAGKGSQPAEGAPACWYEWAGRFTLWPTPKEEGEITLYYTRRPQRLTSQSDSLSLPDKYYQIILDYVLMRAYEMDEDLSAAQGKKDFFDQALNSFGEEERAAQNMTYDVITIFDN